jgi:hypothetical protein
LTADDLIKINIADGIAPALQIRAAGSPDQAGTAHSDG